MNAKRESKYRKLPFINNVFIGSVEILKILGKMAV
jgi:hypothetical protein